MHLRLAAAVYNSIAQSEVEHPFTPRHGRVPRTGHVTHLVSARLFSIFFILFIFTDFEIVSDFQFLAINLFSVEHTIFSIFCYEIFQTQKKIVSKYTYTYHLGSVTLCSIIYVSTNPSIPPLIHPSLHLVSLDRFQIKLQTSGYFTLGSLACILLM